MLMLLIGQAFAQSIGGSTDFYLPETRFSQSLNGPGFGDFSFGTNHWGQVNSRVGTSTVSGDTWSSGFVYVPRGSTRGSASISGTVEGGSYAGHMVDRNGTYSYGDGWVRSSSTTTATGDGSASVTNEGSFSGSSAIYRERNRGRGR